MSADKKPLFERLDTARKAAVEYVAVSSERVCVSQVVFAEFAALLEEAAAALKPQPSPLYLAYKERQKNCSHAGRARIIVFDGQVAVCPDCGDGLPE